MSDNEKRDEWEFGAIQRYRHSWNIDVSRPGKEWFEVSTMVSDDPDGSKCLQRAREMAAAREMGEALGSLFAMVKMGSRLHPKSDGALEISALLRRAGLLDGGEG